MKYHGGVVIPEGPAKGEKAENGLIEEAGKTVREFVCTFISQIEYGIDDRLELDLDIIPWIVRWAAICYSRYAVGRDGRTAYERLRGRSCKAIVVPMGEKVWYKQLGDGGDRRHKAETEWFQGVWLGPATNSSETLIGTTKGVVKASTIKRFGASERWDVNAIIDMKCTPQRPDPGKLGLHIPVRIRVEPEVPFDMPALRPARNEEAPRRAYVMKRHYEEHGYTEGCEGCSRLAAKMKPSPHSNACRERMYRDLKETEEGRKWIEDSEARLGEYFESKIREDNGDREHEVEEKAKEQAEEKAKEQAEAGGAAPGADPIVPLDSGMPSRSKKAKNVASHASRTQKRDRDTEADDGDKAARQVGMSDVSNPGAASSNTPIAPSIPTGPNNSRSTKREADSTPDDDEAPEKVQRIMSVCVGQGAADKLGKLSAIEYKEDLEKMAKEYAERNDAGECFVHIRSRNSSNRDLRALSGLSR